MLTSSHPPWSARRAAMISGERVSGRQTLGPGGAAHELQEAVAHPGGVLEALGRRELLESGAQQLGAGSRVAAEDGRALGDDDGVVALGLRARARRPAAAHVGEGAGRRAAGEAAGALAQRHDLVHGVDRGLRREAGAERADVVGVVVAHLLDDRQPREALVGQLDPHRLAAVLGLPVEAGLVLVDEPQLAHLRLERGLAHDRVHGLGETHHLGHPAALLGGGEVGADTGADVAARADVEHPAVAVLEEVDARARAAAGRRGSACAAASG